MSEHTPAAAPASADQGLARSPLELKRAAPLEEIQEESRAREDGDGLDEFDEDD